MQDTTKMLALSQSAFNNLLSSLSAAGMKITRRDTRLYSKSTKAMRLSDSRLMTRYYGFISFGEPSASFDNEDVGKLLVRQGFKRGPFKPYVGTWYTKIIRTAEGSCELSFRYFDDMLYVYFDFEASN